MKKGTSVVPSSAIAVNTAAPIAPVMNGDRDMRGKEEALESTDRMLPRLLLLQALSPQVDAGHGKPGEFLNSLTNRNYGTSLTIVPILRQRQRVKWIPRTQGGGIECKSADGKVGTVYGVCKVCKFSLWDNDAKDAKDKPPKCTEYWTFPILLLLEGEHEIALMSLGKTQFAAGKTLANLIDYHTKVPAFGAQYSMTTHKEMSPRNEPYYNLEIQGAGFLPQEEAAFKEAETWYSVLRHAKLDVSEAAS